ncbi:NlpC/P60 family protein [Gemmobacter nectariphilus]|uniref:C40 family peptidase n=1 Tax=Gemmobacter nectariphilus TaxID=220343 RepID=UPI00042586B8|nr:NlpC/P60 family protein [Gemmobacter nectariphilus]
MDRRTTPFSGRVAHSSLKGRVEASSFTDGTPARVILPLADLNRSPGGARDRQVLWGERVLVIERREGEAFVMADKDGYCGWIADAALGPDHPVTHRVNSLFSQLYPEPRVQARELQTLPFGAQIRVLSVGGKFVETPHGFVPLAHLRPLAQHDHDPVAVAERFLGVPYLWGCNSAAGLDCSGLAQAAMLACGIPCPGDSDLQAAAGTPVPDTAPVHRGDLVFWKGHVAIVSGPDEIIHATAAFMSVVREPLSTATARILAQGGGPVTHRRRLR